MRIEAQRKLHASSTAAPLVNRRHLIRSTGALAAALALRRARGQPLRTRAAIVIGVDKVGDLPALRAARSGANAIASWLTGEGFEVTSLTDEQAPVRANDIFGAIRAFVQRGTVEQLVVYFAGHGFINAYSEYWLLSEAPDNPNEAVSLIESVALAKQSGIPNVTFISDACRSRADTVRAERVRGSLIFPNAGRANAISDVDQFLATLVGDPSWEVPVADSAGAFAGIYTTCFLDAFKRPYDSMVRSIGGQQVVPNNQLKPYLAAEVPRRAQAVSVRLNQQPDTQVVSGDMIYIARVVGDDRIAAAPGTALTPTIADVADAEFARVGAEGIARGLRTVAPETAPFALASGFTSARTELFEARGGARPIARDTDPRTGFIVYGLDVVGAATNERFGTTVANRGSGATVDVDLRGARAGSVALRFANGFGTVVAALDGYIGEIVVAGGVTNTVSYVPSPQSGMRGAYESEADRLEELRAAVAAAARFGVFRIEGSRDTRGATAGRLAGRIRMLKGIDPTLGLYAAYAYATADIPGQVESVRGIMRGDLSADLFDVALLAGALSGERGIDTMNVFPFCPMLSQGWSLLRVKDVRLPAGLGALRDHLRPSLWSTFDPEGMTLVERALRGGDLR